MDEASSEQLTHRDKIVKARENIAKHKGVEPPKHTFSQIDKPNENPVSGPQASQNTETTTGKKTLEQAIEEYKNQPTSPEAVTNFWKSFIESQIRKSGENIPIPEVAPCDRTAEELAELQAEGRSMVYNPSLDYPLLAKVFPLIKDSMPGRHSNSVEVRDVYDAPTWSDIESSYTTPNIGVHLPEVDQHFKAQELEPQRLSTYLWATSASKELTGHYFDEQDGVYARLNGSKEVRNIHAPKSYQHKRNFAAAYHNFQGRESIVLKNDAGIKSGARSEGFKG